MELKTLKNLYREMLRIRLVEEKIAEIYPEQEMRCPVHLCIGQEAVAAGVSAHLTRDDYAFSAHRSHGHYLAKGGSLNAMMAELTGKVTGCCQGKGGSMHLVDHEAGFLASTPIVASTIPIAVGAAFASKLKKENRVTVVYLGEAATEEGTFHEALNFAALKKLQVLFICENNFFSVYSPLNVRQPANREVYELAKGHGVETAFGDGNDVEAVYQISAKAVKKMRESGEGPAFLEFKTYRWREHCGPNYDNDLGYRTEEEFLAWKKLCPLARTEARLAAAGTNGEEFASIRNEIRDEIEASVQFAKKSPFPGQELLFQQIFA